MAFAEVKMQKMQCTGWSLPLVVLAACAYPPLPELTDGGGEDALTLELLAGDIGGAGNVDGAGPAARFRFASGVAVDRAGNTYVADTFNHTIRKVTPGGTVTTIAGAASVAGHADGAGPDARFDQPASVAIDADGNLYVVERSNCTVRKITTAGVVTTLAGVPRACTIRDGAGAAARFEFLSGVAVDGAGTVYVADDLSQLIRKVTAAGVVTPLAGGLRTAGSTDGAGADARFSSPKGVAVDTLGNVYVADAGNHVIRTISAAGVVSTLAGTAGVPGAADGTGAAARFNTPEGVALDDEGTLYVADTGNHTLRKIGPGGAVTTLAGAAGARGNLDGAATTARFNRPAAVTVDAARNLYVSDRSNTTLRKITAAGVVTTLAGAARQSGGTDGAGPTARFNNLAGVALDGAGNVYVTDRSNSTVRKATPEGIVTTLAGVAGMRGTMDGPGPAARFDSPVGVAVDGAGNLLVADAFASTIRKVTTGGVTTIAGAANMYGFDDGPGAAARFGSAADVAIDGRGNAYVTDESNATLRKLTAAGVVTTLAGSPQMSGSADGTGAAARFYFPAGLAVDSAGDLYVADRASHTIRKVTAEGVVTTIAGVAGLAGSVDGVGGEARFNFPGGLAIDDAGNVYVADTENSAIRKVTPDGVTTTIAGSAGRGRIVLGTSPGLAFPLDLAIRGDSIFVVDNDAILVLRHAVR